MHYSLAHPAALKLDTIQTVQIGQCSLFSVISIQIGSIKDSLWIHKVSKRRIPSFMFQKGGCSLIPFPGKVNQNGHRTEKQKCLTGLWRNINSRFQWTYVASWWSPSVTRRGRSKGAGDLSAGWTGIQWPQVRHGETRECGIYWVNRDTLLLFPAKPGPAMACRRTSTICDWFVPSSLPSPSLPNPLPFLTHTFT